MCIFFYVIKKILLDLIKRLNIVIFYEDSNYVE